MQKWLLTFSIFLSSLIDALPIQDRHIDPAALSQLASALGIPEDENIVAATQKYWLRKPGLERWEMAELPPDQHSFVLNWATEQGLFSPWKPSDKSYDKALILGATTLPMQKRLDYLKQLWEEGVRFEEIVWLTGDRPLDSRVDGLTDRCRTEAEAARLIWEEADLPADLRALPVVFVTVPMKRNGALLERPNTGDTILAWLETALEPCKALFVANQPFCGYQFAVINNNLPLEFLFDVVGPGTDPTSHPAAASVTLDVLARWIDQERLKGRDIPPGSPSPSGDSSASF